MKPTPNAHILQLLLSKYRADPKGFRSYLPEVAQLLDATNPPRRVSQSPYGLTERERAHHQQELQGILERLQRSALSKEDAVKGLEHCATLIEDDSLRQEVGYETLVGLLKAAIGKSPGSFKANTTVPVQEKGEVLHNISLVRGVTLGLDRYMRLVSVTVTPRKVRERRELMKIVGIGRDVASDVAERHDYYLTQAEPHAFS